MDPIKYLDWYSLNNIFHYIFEDFNYDELVFDRLGNLLEIKLSKPTDSPVESHNDEIRETQNPELDNDEIFEIQNPELDNDEFF
jgi:hypothetical protein